jgi:hypothetical protein
MNAMKSNFPSHPFHKKAIFIHLLPVIFMCTFLFFLSSCRDNIRVHPEEVTLSWNFANSTEGWTGDFADYPIGEEDFYELVFEHDTLPPPLDNSQMALKLSGNNHSDDLFMFVKKKVSGLEPNTIYYLTFTVEFATNVPNGTMGTGGSPGESVYVAAGATITEPVKVADQNNYYGMNISKCNQSRNGDDMVVIGNLANGTDQPVYTLKTVSNEKPFHVTSGPEGEMWIIIGTDSGFEATTIIYYNSIKVRFF